MISARVLIRPGRQISLASGNTKEKEHGCYRKDEDHEEARFYPQDGQGRRQHEARGHRSPRRLLGLDPPVVGEPFTRSGGRPLGRILAVDPGRELTARILGGVMSYRVRSTPDGSTRLLLKVVLERGRLLAPFVCVGDLVMARRQLLTLKALAEA